MLKKIAVWNVAFAVMCGVIFAADVTPTAAGVDTGVVAAPTAAEAEAAFRAARQMFVTVAEGGADAVADVEGDVDHKVDVKPVTVAGGKPENIALQDIRLVMDVENVTLKDVFVRCIKQVAAYTGPWTVKWRLKPENMGLMDERVNLTAEAKFDEFVALLTERVRNMSGVQLYVTVFESARTILVTDTYY